MSVADRLASLSPAQRELFERLRQKQRESRARRTPPPVEPVSGPLGLGDWPLSFDQERIWILHRLDPRLISWNVDAGSYVDGDFDLPTFLAALDDLVRRHAALRTVFPVIDGRPIQRVVEWIAPEVTRIDLRALPPELRERAGHRAIFDHTRKPFDLERGPLVRMALVQLGDGEHLYLLTIHHLATDWITFQIFFRELMLSYLARREGRPSPLPPLPVQYPDYVLWERQWWQGEALAEESAFWQRELADFPLVLDLPADRPRPPVQSQRGGLYRVHLGAALSDRLRALARGEGATTLMAVLAALYALFVRVTGRERMVLGTNTANRARPELEPVVGFFLTQLPLAGDAGGDPTFRELLGRSRKTALSAYAHQSFPFSKLLEALAATRPQVEALDASRQASGPLAADRSRYPIVQVLLLILEVLPPVTARGLAFRPVGLYDGNSRWDLMFGLYDDHDSGLAGPLEYNADLFDPATVGRLLELFYRVVEAAVADPEVRLSQLPASADVARLQVLLDLDAGEEPPPEVEALAARALPALRRLGAASGARVGLLLPPSPARAALALAARRLGGLPLPIDPAEPALRLGVLLADADLAVLVHGDGGLPEGIDPVGTVRAPLAQLGLVPGEPPPR
jgi:Condensation domain